MPPIKTPKQRCANALKTPKQIPEIDILFSNNNYIIQMKSTKFFTVFMLFATLAFFGCTNEDLDKDLSKGSINANKIREILSKSPIKFVEIYEYNSSTGKWDLAADNQQYYSGMDLCHVEGTYLYLNGGGDKSYPISNVPSHQLSGKYYFNLEYLVSIDLDKNASAEDNKMFLYFKY